MTKIILLFAAITFSVSSGAFANNLDQDGFLRDEANQLVRLSQYDALKACPAGTHLPTVRDLGLEFQKQGGKGILERSQVMVGYKPPPGYYLWETKNSIGVREDVYISTEGRKVPDGNVGHQSYWTSSTDPHMPYLAYAYHGHLQNFDYYYTRTSKAPVRCFR